MATAPATSPNPTAVQEWRRHWPLVLAAMAGLSFASIPATTLGLFMAPLEEAFGWSRTMVSSGMMVFASVGLFMGPFAGALLDKLGPRRCAIPGLILSGTAFAAFSLMTGMAWQWWTVWVLYAFASLLIRSMVWNSAVSNTFMASRGLAIALVLAGLALPQVIGPPLANWLIGTWDWRAAYLALGLGWAGFALLLVILFFHDRQSRRPASAKAGAPAPAVQTRPGGLTFKEALRNPAILKIALAIFLSTLMGAAVSIHLVPLLEWAGTNRTTAAGLAAAMGAGSIIGKLLTGALVDRFTGGLLPFAVFSLPALGYFVIWQAGANIPLLGLGVFLMGYGSGGSLQMGTYLTTRYGGMRNFGKIFGTISSLMAFSGGLGPITSGWIYDQTQSYEAVLMIAIPALLIAGIAVARLGPYPEFRNEGV